jgi:hypothetical protein
MLLLTGCGPSALRAELFSVDFVDASYPVMLSPTPSCAGRSVQGKSGSYSTSSKYYSSERWNVMGASEQLSRQVGWGHACVQINQAVFSAEIKWGFTHELDEELTIDGAVAD